MKDKQQKTIFIAIFQGVEAKNILRTPILETLLKDERVRIVLFTNSKERAQYYQKEFQNDRLIYEVIEMQPMSWIDRFFNKLKLILLKTETTDLLRRMTYEEGRNFIVHVVNKSLNLLLARSCIRRLTRYLDFLLVREHTYARYFDAYVPDLVFLANLFSENEVHLLREAKRRSVKSVGFLNSWDQVTSRWILRLLPDMYVVYNNIVKQELVAFNEMDPKYIYVGGIAQYDVYKRHTPVSRNQFFSTVGIDPKKKLLLYAPMGRTFSASDWDMIDMLHRLSKEEKFGPDVEMLVRFQPNDFVDEDELAKRPHLHYDYPGVRFSTERSLDWDMGEKELDHLTDTLYHISILVCYASSIAIDAAIFDKPVININMEIVPNLPMRKSPPQYFSVTHYKKALATGGIRVVSSVSELCASIKNYLADPSLDAEGRRRLVETQCVFTDGKSGERIGYFLLQQL